MGLGGVPYGAFAIPSRHHSPTQSPQDWAVSSELKAEGL